jgi:hypothetical protein
MENGSETVMQQAPQISSFKGKPVIILNPNEKYTFSFGVTKAKLILANLDAIKSFVESFDKSVEKENP